MPDWTTQVADTVDQVVDLARERAVKPVRSLARGIVFGLLAGIFLLAALILLTIAATRALNAYLPGDAWAAHVVIGGIFVAGGLFSWAHRNPRSARS